jgi:hypothetical protein
MEFPIAFCFDEELIALRLPLVLIGPRHRPISRLMIGLVNHPSRAVPGGSASGNEEHSEEDGDEGEEAFLQLFVSLLLVH